MDEIDLFPEALRSQSLSEREMVLSSQQALEALEILVAANFALLGWGKYADGRHGHPPGGVMGTEPIEQEVGERWENYVQRSARFCAETMTKEQPAWNTHPGSAHLPLSLCLRVYPTKPVEALTPGARGSGSETDIAGRGSCNRTGVVARAIAAAPASKPRGRLVSSTNGGTEFPS